jgi:isopentenyldiphosphate isomerase
MAQRAFTKTKSPGAWGPAVAGTVEEGEDYDSNIVKEIQEELGISISLERLTKVVKIHVKGETNDYFAQWYTTVLDVNVEDLVLQKEEVEQVAWFHPEELILKIQEHPEEFTPTSPSWTGMFLNEK